MKLFNNNFRIELPKSWRKITLRKVMTMKKYIFLKKKLEKKI